METCSNCGGLLTEESIRLAVEDAGIPREELSFCCPTYSDEGGCQGWAKEDETAAAYWSTK